MLHRPAVHLFIALSSLIAPTIVYPQQWQRVVEVPEEETTALFQNGDTLAAAVVNRLFITHNGGQAWSQTSIIDTGLDFVTALYLGQGAIYVGTVVDGVYRSTDGGQAWQSDNSGLTGLGAHSITGFATRGDSLFASTSGAGVFVKKISTHSAWSAYSTGLPWQVVESLTQVDGVLYAGAGGNATLSRRANGQAAWEEVPFDVFDGSVNSFLGVFRSGDVLLGAGSRGLYRSTDNGNTWTYHNPGTGILARAKFVAAGNRIVAKLIKPVPFSFARHTDDNGLTWSNFEPALPNNAYGYDLAFMNGYLWSARSDGLWRSETLTPSQETLKNTTPLLGYNFPNPFFGETTIPVTVSSESWLEINIYDSRGTLAATVWNGTLPPGTHHFRFQPNGFPAGTYWCRMITPTHMEAKPLVKIQ